MCQNTQGRELFLKDQEKLFDLVVEKHGGTLAGSFSTAVYDLYVNEGLDTENVAERIAQFDDTDGDVFMVSPEQRIAEALNLAHRLAAGGASHQKEYCIDQMVRVLAGAKYREFVRNYEKGEDGPETYYWGTGI